jgi:DNA-binding transcriptional LysR family regulator
VPPNHDLAEKESLAIGELLEYPFICREEGSGTREVINEYLSQNCNLALNISMELGSPEAVKGAVEAGMGVSVVSRATIQKELKLDTLRAINLVPKLERPFSFVHQKQKFRLRAMEELLDFARDYCEDHQEEKL